MMHGTTIKKKATPVADGHRAETKVRVLVIPVFVPL